MFFTSFVVSEIFIREIFRWSSPKISPSYDWGTSTQSFRCLCFWEMTYEVKKNGRFQIKKNGINFRRDKEREISN